MLTLCDVALTKFCSENTKLFIHVYAKTYGFIELMLAHTGITLVHLNNCQLHVVAAKLLRIPRRCYQHCLFTWHK